MKISIKKHITCLKKSYKTAFSKDLAVLVREHSDHIKSIIINKSEIIINLTYKEEK